MWRVIVTVRHRHDQAGIDLEVPAEVPLTHLTRLISDALNWDNGTPGCPVDYIIREARSGRILPQQSSLAELNLWDGSCLLFEPISHRTTTNDAQLQPAMLISESGRQYPLTRRMHYLGRSTSTGSNDDSLIDLKPEPQSKTVSRRHAEIRHEQDNWVLYCLPSAQNPTLHNGSPLEHSQRCFLEDGDWVQLGMVKLKFHITGKQ